MADGFVEKRRNAGSVTDRAPPAGETASIRHDRVRLMAFVTDTETETLLREVLEEALPAGGAFHQGGVRAAITMLRKIATPQTLILDVSGETSPLESLARLAEVVEPSAQVLVIGTNAHMAFYREVTRGLGALDYLAKPLTRDAVRRIFLPYLADRPDAAASHDTISMGRVISVTGARGGVGTTTIATNLAWLFGNKFARHTALLDADLHFGSAAMLLDSPTGTGLRVALEAPDRLDTLFIERAASPVSERLHVLATEIRLSDTLGLVPNAMQNLLEAMRRRYALIVADTPRMPHPLFADLFEHAHQRVVVVTPTLAAIRDGRRLIELRPGAAQTGRAVVVLNRAGLRGGLSRKQVEDTLGRKVDLVIPDLPVAVETSASLGVAISNGRNPFAKAMAELARQTAYLQLLDSPSGLPGPERRRGWWRWR